jgi:hypothetical protein
MIEISPPALLAGIGCILAILLIGWLIARRRSEVPSRTVHYNSQGKLVAVGDVERDIPARFTGKGTWSSKPIQLEPGQYRLLYAFSSGAVRIGLVSSFDGEDETLLIKSGKGVEGFTVGTGGRYLFVVQPAQEAAEWQIEYQHLTHYGRASEEDISPDEIRLDS